MRYSFTVKTKPNRKLSNFSFLEDKNLVYNNPFYIFSELEIKQLSGMTTVRKNNFPWKHNEINFKVQRNFTNKGKISSPFSFHQYFQV